MSRARGAAISWGAIALLLGSACGSDPDAGDDDAEETDADTESAGGSSTGGADPTGALEESGGEETGEVEEPDDAFEIVKADVDRDTNPDVSDAQRLERAAGQRRFATDLYGAMERDTANVMISPVSLQTAFALARVGALDTTADEVDRVLHFEGLDDALHPAYNDLDLALTSRARAGTDEVPELQLKLVNGLFAHEEFASGMEAPFMETIARHYDAGVRLVDIIGDPEGSADRINDWVADFTNDRIKDLLPGGVFDVDGDGIGDADLAVINALYYKASWAVPFDETQTEDRPFSTLAGQSVDAPMMHNGTLSAAYGVGPDWQAVAIPYTDHNLSMVVIVPDDFPTFEAGLDADTLAGLFAALQYEVVDLQIPKFQFRDGTRGFAVRDPISLEPTGPLVDLGMYDAFKFGAGWAGIHEEISGIRSVLHQTFVAVDEKGTEAAAATAIIFGGGCDGADDPPQATVTMTVDRPFLVVIRDEPSGALLFLGRVGDPTQH